MFTNKHHKPVHKRDSIAHICDLPYLVPKAHSIYSPSPPGLANNSIDTLSYTSTIDDLHRESHLKDYKVGAQKEQRTEKSGQVPPSISRLNPDQLNGLLPPLDMSTTLEDHCVLENLGGFSTILDNEQPLFSTLLSSAYIDWSHYDVLDFDNYNFAASSYNQAPSFPGLSPVAFDHHTLAITSTFSGISN